MAFDFDLDEIQGTGYDRGNDSLHVLSVAIAAFLDLTSTTGNIAVTDTETTLYIDNAPTKVINGLSIMIDTSVIEAADTFDFKVYYRIKNGGTLKAIPKVTKSGVQAGPIYVVDLKPYRYGMKVTAQRTGGTNRTFEVETIREA